MGVISEELAYATIKEIEEKNSENLIEMINNEIGMDVEKKAQIDSKIKEIGKKIYNKILRKIDFCLTSMELFQNLMKEKSILS